MLRLAFHLLVAVCHLYCFFYYFYLNHYSNIMNHEVLRTIGKVRYSFLTGWNFTAQSVYFGFCLCEDISNRNKTSFLAKFSQTKLVQHLKNLLFVAIVFPTTCLVTFVFWTFFLFNRDLLYPKVIDEVLPTWYNHLLHTNILVAALVEIWMVHHPYPRRWRCLLALNLYSHCYGISLLLTYYYKNAWPYPLLWSVSWTMRLCFYVVCLAATIGFFFLGEHLNKTIWGEKRREYTNGTTVKKIT